MDTFGFGFGSCHSAPILIETDDRVQRMTVREMFESFDRYLEDFEALNVCVG